MLLFLLLILPSLFCERMGWAEYKPIITDESEISDGMQYAFSNVHSKKYLDVTWSDFEGIKTIQYTFSGKNNQRFKIYINEDNSYSIVSISSSRALKSVGTSMQLGIKFDEDTWETLLSDDYRWSISCISGGCTIKSASGYVWDVAGWGQNDAAVIGLSNEGNNQANQKLKIVPVYHVTGLELSNGGCPGGPWEEAEFDLNQGSGRFTKLCIERDPSKSPLTNIKVFNTGNYQPENCDGDSITWTLGNMDFNNGQWNSIYHEYVYFCTATAEQQSGVPISDVQIYWKDFGDMDVFIPVNLNQNGDDRFILYDIDYSPPVSKYEVMSLKFTGPPTGAVSTPEFLGNTISNALFSSSNSDAEGSSLTTASESCSSYEKSSSFHWDATVSVTVSAEFLGSGVETGMEFSVGQEVSSTIGQESCQSKEISLPTTACTAASGTMKFCRCVYSKSSYNQNYEMEIKEEYLGGSKPTLRKISGVYKNLDAGDAYCTTVDVETVKSGEYQIKLSTKSGYKYLGANANYDGVQLYNGDDGSSRFGWVIMVNKELYTDPAFLVLVYDNNNNPKYLSADQSGNVKLVSVCGTEGNEYWLPLKTFKNNDYFFGLSSALSSGGGKYLSFESGFPKLISDLTNNGRDRFVLTKDDVAEVTSGSVYPDPNPGPSDVYDPNSMISEIQQ